MDRHQQAIYGTHVTDDQQATVIATPWCESWFQRRFAAILHIASLPDCLADLQK
jgi:hypothetical protein